MTSLVRRLKQNIESFGVTTLNNKLKPLVAEIDKIPVKNRRDVGDSVLPSVSSDNIHVLTTQKLRGIKNDLINHLYSCNIDCDGTENISELIEMVTDIVSYKNTNATITSYDNSIEYGENCTIRYTLTDENNTNLTQTVEVYVDNTLHGTSNNGTYTITNLSTGTHNIQVKFTTQDLTLNDCTSNQVQVTVNTPAKTQTYLNLSLSNGSITVDGTSEVTGTLYNAETDETITGTINVYLDNSYYGSLSNGTLTLQNLSAGTYSVKLKYDGSSIYDESTSSTVTLTVNKLDETLTITPSHTTNGTSTTVTAKGHGTITIKEGTTVLATGTNTATYTYTASGDKTFKISSAGNSTYKSKTVSWTVTAENSNYTVTASNVTITTTGGEIGATGKVKAVLKNIPTSLRIEIYEVGKSTRVATSTSGTCEYTFTLTSSSKSYYVKIVGATVDYTTYSTYTSGNYSLTGTKKATTLTKGAGTSGTVYYGWNAYFHLKDSGGNGVSGKTVKAYWYNGSSWTTTTLTDYGSGKYGLQHKLNDGDAATVSISWVKFEGDSTYNESTLSNINIPVTALPTVTTRIYPTSVAGGSPWENMKTGNSSSDYAKCRITSKMAYPTLSIYYTGRLSNVYKVTNVQPKVALALEQNPCVSPNQPTIKTYVNSTLALDNYSGTVLGNGSTLGVLRWFDHETTSDCNVTVSNNKPTFTVTVDTPVTVSTAGRLDACNYSLNVTYKQLQTQT